jgi:teichoic acid transport system ATP-binding protein
MSSYSIVVEHVHLTYRRVNSLSLKQKFVRNSGGKQARIQEFKALEDISFQVEKGHTVGIIGSNGAGKSTLLKALAGVFQPDSGNINLYSESISLLTLGTGFENELNGIDNIYLNGAVLGISKKEIDKKLQSIIAFADIGDFIYSPLRTYSTGMRSRLAFAISSNIEPDILLVDEMLGVGDEEFKEKSSARIRELILSDRTVVLVSHSMPIVRELCDMVLWLEKGRVMDYGETAKVVDAYMEHTKKKRAEKLANLKK